MKVGILYFGMIAESTGCTGEQLEIASDGKNPSVGDLLKNVYLKYPGLEQKTFKIAVNQVLVDPTYELHSEDEIAILPPFAGG